MIPFSKPLVLGTEIDYLRDVMSGNKFCGDGSFTKKSSAWIQENLHVQKALITTSCTHALEMTAILLGIQKGDEVIMPSFTFSSSANAFALRGAKIVFIDIRPDTMNIDEKLIEQAITSRTKVIVPVHYAGVASEMDQIMQIARKHNLAVVEDAAQSILSTYKGKDAGTFGEFGAISFHETKNIQCGEGGALLINDSRYAEAAEIIREKGTNRAKFFRGEIDKYGWVEAGSSYLPSELNAAFLFAQLEKSREVIADRMNIWNMYVDEFSADEFKGKIELPIVPSHCTHNAHIFYIKTKDLEERAALIKLLKSRDIHSVFHYIPLHSSVAGKKYGEFCGEDVYTTKESERILRLPLYYKMTKDEMKTVVQGVRDFYAAR